MTIPSVPTVGTPQQRREPAGADQVRRIVRTLNRASGRLATAATGRMNVEFSWFAALPAQERSWVAEIVHAGVRGFISWYDSQASAAPGTAGTRAAAAPGPGPGVVSTSGLAGSLFGLAPRTLAGVISLRQTVDLIRLSIEVIETNLDDLLEPEDVSPVHDAIARYAREIAFATAEVYARAAETRGAWDARLEALVVDAVTREHPDPALLSRAAALGFSATGQVCVLVGSARDRSAGLFEEIHRRAQGAKLTTMCALHGDALVVVAGGLEGPEAIRTLCRVLLDVFGPGPVVSGPLVADLISAHRSASAALSSFQAASGWPEAPRPVSAAELLPERVIAGDAAARTELVETAYRPLTQTPLIETLSAYLASGCRLEPTARAIFVHANTVRYRLRQIAEATGLDPTDPRDAWTLRIAMTLGRQAAGDRTTASEAL